MHNSVRPRQSVFYRVLLLTVLVMLVFYAIGLYLNNLGIRNVQQDLARSAGAEASYIAKEIERELQNLIVMEQEFLSDPLLLRMSIAYGVMSDYQRTDAIRTLSDQLARIKRFSTLVDQAKAHFPQMNRTLSSTTPIFLEMDEVVTDLLMHTMFVERQQVTEVDGQLVLTRCFPNRRSEDTLCVIALTLTPQALVSRLRNMRASPDNALILLREDGSVFAGMNGAEALLETAQASGAVAAAPRSFVSGGVEYMSIEQAIPLLGLRCVSFTPIEPALNPLREHRMWTWILTSLVALLLLAYLLYFQRSVFRPLDNIFIAIEQVQRGSDFQVDHQSNEFEAIGRQFRHMITRIERLAGQVYEEKIRAQRAEIVQLQMQIRPHFFYNTLFIIYRLAQRDGNEDIALLSNHLSRYYAYITRSPKDAVPLSDEILHVSDYLEIQRFRFGNRIRIEVEPVPEVLSRERIPPLVIQPLVENAFTHGLHDKASGGLLTLRYAWDDERFQVIVADNGDRMDEAAVSALREALEGGQLDEGSALMNLHRRLRLRYGEAYGLELSSLGNGLCASVSFQRGVARKERTP